MHIHILRWAGTPCCPHPCSVCCGKFWRRKGTACPYYTSITRCAAGATFGNQAGHNAEPLVELLNCAFWRHRCRRSLMPRALSFRCVQYPPSRRWAPHRPRNLGMHVGDFALAWCRPRCLICCVYLWERSLAVSTGCANLGRLLSSHPVVEHHDHNVVVSHGDETD